MSGQMDEVLKHRYIYVPRGIEKDTIQPGKQLGLAVARERRAQVTVRAAADAADFYQQVHDLALDCVNQAGISSVQTISPPK